MNFKTALTALFISACTVTANAQQPSEHASSARRMHQEAHKAQLANHKSRIDRSVITDFIESDVRQRENPLSKESQGMIADLLTEAHKHIGKPYVHGAKGPRQFDCSGFTSYVYKQFGLSISPSSRMQYTQGTPVDRKDLRKGDLVFFTSRSSGRNVGHVGIVVSADNETGHFKFIHASIRGVKVSEFEGYYVPRYIGARRIITD